MDSKGLIINTPDHEFEARPRADRKGLALVSWASAVTAVLLVVLIWGAVYVSELKARQCMAPATSGFDHKTKDYHRVFVNKDDGTQLLNEDIHVDEADRTELIVTKDDSGSITLINVIDYKTKISAAYIPSMDQCHLLAGVNTDHWDNWGGAEKNKTEVVSPESTLEEDYESSGNKVTDLSILPAAIRPYCNGKDNYWSQPATNADKRQKRGGVNCRRVCEVTYSNGDWRTMCYIKCSF